MRKSEIIRNERKIEENGIEIEMRKNDAFTYTHSHIKNRIQN